MSSEIDNASLIYLGALFAVLHSLATTQAGPTAFSQREIPANDEAALVTVFDKFARWQSIRCPLQVMNFGVNLCGVNCVSERVARASRVLVVKSHCSALSNPVGTLLETVKTHNAESGTR